MLNGASCLAWVAGIVGENDIGTLLEQVEAAYQGPSSVLFLPYLSGERTPHNNPYARGVFFGMDADSGPLDLVQAVLEGVAFSFADAQDCLRQAGTDCACPGIIGGGARSRLWAQIMADVLGRPLQRYQGGAKGPAFGAARLARLALSGAEPATVCLQPALEQMIEPDLANTARYGERLPRFRALYRQLRNEF